MKIIIDKLKGELPVATNRPGYQLESFIPKGYDWQQIGSGKGEGQFIVMNCEWGVYYPSNSELALELHSGEIAIKRALVFIKDFIEHTRGDGRVSVTIEGGEQWID